MPGGLDIFLCKLKENGFSNLENIGSPVNSSYDDFTFILDKKQERGYLTETIIYNQLMYRPGQYNMHEDFNIMLNEIEVGMDLSKIIDINPIYFDLNKSNIRPDAAFELNKIVKVMNDNPTMVNELDSHTHCRASAAYNLTLSDRRAKLSAKYVKE